MLVLAASVNAQERKSTPDDEAPVVTRRVTPPYPALARAQRISGAVLVDVDVDSQGKVTKAVAITGDKLLRDVAQKAALFWQFNGANSAGTRSVRLTFIFHDRDYVAPEKEPKFRCPYELEIIGVGMP